MLRAQPQTALVSEIRMPIRILIADDNRPVRTALGELLKREGWEVLEAANGKQAIDQAIATHPDLAVLDLVMPQMDGLTASRKLKELMPDLPILMYTMHYSKLLEIEACKVGVRKMVDKPDTKQLIASVRSLLNIDAAADATPKAEPVPATNATVQTAQAEASTASMPHQGEPGMPGDTSE